MGANPHANGGLLLRDLQMPDFRAPRRKCAITWRCHQPRYCRAGKFLSDVAKLNQDQRNFGSLVLMKHFRIFLGAVFEITNRQWDAREKKNDEFLAPEGQVIDSMLSEHQCEGC